MAVNTKNYIEAFLKIKNKEGNVIPFEINIPQMKLYNAIKKQYDEGKPIRIVILKARQMGFSTLTEGMIFKVAATEKNISAGAVAHEKDATNNLLEMFKRYYDNLPNELMPSKKRSNAKEVVFAEKDGGGLNSRIRCMTAGNENIGRSETFQYLHLSEFAFWPGDIITAYNSIMQTVPNIPESMVIVESTANGYNEFKTLWDNAVAGENDYIPVFCAWHELPEYQMPYNGFTLTEEEENLKRLYKLTNEQLTWRRWCIANNCNHNLDLFKQEYPSCPEEAFLMTGRPVFNIKNIVERIETLRQRAKSFITGDFRFEWNSEFEDFIKSDSIKFKESSRGTIKIYEEPIKGHPYVLGGDTKGEGSDWFTATVLDNTNGKRVASLHMQLQSSYPYTHQVFCLGKYYNDALIGIEVNFNTLPVEELQRLRYPKQYVRRKYDSYNKEIDHRFGWRTDGNTRPLIIDKYTDLIENNIELINDIDTLEEAMSFVYDDKGRPDALPGHHDDLLFSDMIANEIREQQSFEINLLSEKGQIKWTDDMWEDYNAASPELRKEIIRKWGNPL